MRLFSQARLRHKSEFDNVFASRRRFFSPLLGLYYCKNQREFPRIGIISAKRNVKLAVARNRIRRIVKEQFRLQQDTLGGHDMVIVVQKKAMDASNQELQQCINDLFKRLRKSSQPA